MNSAEFDTAAVERIDTQSITPEMVDAVMAELAAEAEKINQEVQAAMAA